MKGAMERVSQFRADLIVDKLLEDMGLGQEILDANILAGLDDPSQKKLDS